MRLEISRSGNHSRKAPISYPIIPSKIPSTIPATFFLPHLNYIAPCCHHSTIRSSPFRVLASLSMMGARIGWLVRLGKAHTISSATRKPILLDVLPSSSWPQGVRREEMPYRQEGIPSPHMYVVSFPWILAHSGASRLS